MQNSPRSLGAVLDGHLLKAVETGQDAGLGTYALHYLRDKEKREVDFVVVRNGEPWMYGILPYNLSEMYGNFPYIETGGCSPRDRTMRALRHQGAFRCT